MIVKKREIPQPILKLQALLRRLPANNQKIPLIKEELSRREAGYKGESALDFPLSFLDKQHYFILHDLRLPDGEYFFQMDTVVISQKFILILEVKNIAGALYFDEEFNQMIRTKDGEEIAFPDPLIQVKRQASQLQRWLGKNQLPTVPIYPLVVISNPQTIIRVSPESSEHRSKVIRSEILPAAIKKIALDTTDFALSDKEIKRLIRLLKKQHTEIEYQVLEKFQIKESELLKGVACTECGHIPLIRIHGKWFCKACKTRSRDAHLAAIKDFLHLIDSTVSNGKLRDFLKISSSATANRIVRSLNLPSEGFNKTKKYHLENFHQ